MATDPERGQNDMTRATWQFVEVLGIADTPGFSKGLADSRSLRAHHFGSQAGLSNSSPGQWRAIGD